MTARRIRHNKGDGLVKAEEAREFLGLAMVMGAGGAIEHSERMGQQDMVRAASRLPKDLCDRAAWEKLGFTFGADVDDIFVEATFPAGWCLKPSDHSMWSYVMDAKGRRRAAVFYKAAFYDRSAHARLEPRFVVTAIYSGTEEGSDLPKGAKQIVVKDAGAVLRKFGEPTADYDEGRKLDTQARTWLKAEYPGADVTAYWD